MYRLAICLLEVVAATASAQTITVRPAPLIRMPAPTVDGNSPGVWQNGVLTVFTSTGQPSSMYGPNIGSLSVGMSPLVFPSTHYPLWIESVWLDEADGALYGWYHHEARVCNDRLAVPSIGALVSHDGGMTFEDLGIVLSSSAGTNCGAQNGFFAGGHGDFSVIRDQSGQYFYFFFTNYGGSVQYQGIALARMAAVDLANPAGKVWKYAHGEWTEPGVGGAVTPLFPANVAWERSNADSYWGPAVHWNKSIESYVMLLNRSCCQSGWPQEGIYASIGSDPGDPHSWSGPVKILDDSGIGFAPGYYPQAFGTGPGETDTLAGEKPRLFVKGVSRWELVFDDPGEAPPPDDVCPGGAPNAFNDKCDEPAPGATRSAARRPGPR